MSDTYCSVDKQIKSYTHAFMQASAIFAFKDLDSNFLYANPFCLDFLGYRKENDIIGCNDYDFFWCEFAGLYLHEEQITLETKSCVSLVPSIDRHGNEILFFSTRELVYDTEGTAKGILCQARPVVHKNLLELSNLLHNKISTKEKYTLKLENPQLNRRNLTRCERECLFFLLRGNSAKMIASILCRTKRCIDFHIENLKIKFNVNSKFELISKAIQEGHLYEIPKSLCQKKLLQQLK